MMVRIAALIFLGAFTGLLQARDLEFRGKPTTKIEMREGVTATTAVSPAEAEKSETVISREGDRYFWFSRNNVPLRKVVSGAYVTYIADSGAGYVRVLSPSMREAIKNLPKAQQDREFVYVEHLIHQMGSITYFGK